MPMVGTILCLVHTYQNEILKCDHNATNGTCINRIHGNNTYKHKNKQFRYIDESI